MLARLPDAPEGVRGISLFLVPKYLLKADGSPGDRNDLLCTSLEHKLGIHASPTCVMTFGQNQGAVGYLIGEENQGLAHMFTMMNEARQKVGLQGLGISERAYQQARDYAKERVQGRKLGQKGGDRVTIIHHPDVRRMLLTMKAQIEAMRAFCYTVSVDNDYAHRHTDSAVTAARQARVDLLTPIVKGWCTELAVEIASLGHTGSRRDGIYRGDRRLPAPGDVFQRSGYHPDEIRRLSDVRRLCVWCMADDACRADCQRPFALGGRGRPHSVPVSWAPRLPPTLPTPMCRSCFLTSPLSRVRPTASLTRPLGPSPRSSRVTYQRVLKYHIVSGGTRGGGHHA